MPVRSRTSAGTARGGDVVLKIHKVVASLPSTLEPDAIYAVRAGAGFDLYIADSTGSVAHKVNDNVGSGGGGGPVYALPDQMTKPAPPAADTISLYSRKRAGAGMLEVQRPNGRDFPIQPHFGANRVRMIAPYGTAPHIWNVSRTVNGTTTSGSFTWDSLLNSTSRWRVTSGAVAGNTAEERTGFIAGRTTVAKSGGFFIATRIGLTGLTADAGGFFGLHNNQSALTTPFDMASTPMCVGFGFQRANHTTWQFVHRAASSFGSVTFVDTGIPIVEGHLLTPYLYQGPAPDNADTWFRLVNEDTEQVAEYRLTTPLATAKSMAWRSHLNNGATAAAVSFECCGWYMETDY